LTTNPKLVSQEMRARLLAAFAELRPELHRYCARLAGSTFDGEDIVQDVIARALAAVEEMAADVPLRPWLFRIAHNRALDHLKSQAIRKSEPLDAAADIADENAMNAEEAMARREAVASAVSRFVHLPVAQRSAVILKDVLGHSLAEIAELLDLSVDAVKAALSRGRAKLHQVNAAAAGEPTFAGAPSEEAARFVILFNHHNWDGLRALLAEDVHLSQTALAERRGRADVGQFFTIYAQIRNIRLKAARLDGGHGDEVIAVYTQAADLKPAYFMQVDWREAEIVRIRDFRYATYVVDGADIVVAIDRKTRRQPH
jgi:RNA polymerase sigma-70 factor (ECF subfamily)